MATSALTRDAVDPHTGADVSLSARPQRTALMADLHFGFLLAVAIIVGGFIVGNATTIILSLSCGLVCAVFIAAVRIRRRRL